MKEREAVAEALHNAGIDPFTQPLSQSGDEWRKHRLKIADELIRQGIGVVEKCDAVTF